MSKPRTPWCEFNYGIPAFVCVRCGVTEPVVLPIAVTDLAKQSDRFCREHRACMAKGAAR